MRGKFFGLVIFMLCLVFVGQSFAADKVELGIQLGDKMVTRTNLAHAKGKIFWYNMSLVADIIAAGTEVVIDKVSGKSISFTVAGQEEKYTITTMPEHYNKFFVKTKQELGLDKMSDKVKANIQKRKVEVGMTKTEVLTALGCPSYIGYGKNSWDYDFAQVLESDSWYYNLNKNRIEYIVEFENKKVKEIVERK